MILAEKVQFLRKKSGWSQEELAEKLAVSRQSVSKWESAASIPDINKILELARLFGVTTDYLLKDDLEETAYTQTSEDEAQNRRIVSMPEANDFLENKRKEGRLTGLGAVLCVVSPAPLIALNALSQPNPFGIRMPESTAQGVGVIALLLLVALAVTAFLYSGTGMKRFEPLKSEDFELEYGVSGILRERCRSLEKSCGAKVAAGVALCILCPVPLVAAGIAGSPDAVITLLTVLLLAMIAAAVFLFISAGSVKSGYDLLLREGDYREADSAVKKRTSRLAGIYWPSVTAVYLLWSFLLRKWDFTWVIWPVAGLVFAAVCAALKKEDRNRP